MMKKTVINVMVGLLFCTLLFSGCSQKNKPDNNKSSIEVKSIKVYSGAGLRKPMEKIGNAFEKKTGVKVNFNYAGSAQLLSQMELSKEGDIFIPGDTVDVEKAKEKNFVTDYEKVVYHIPVIGVPKGNPAKITGLNDLTKPGIKLIIGDEKANAVGKLAIKIFKKNNILSEVEKNIVAKDATINEVVTHTAMKQCDASIITADNVINSKDIEIVEIPDAQNEIGTVPVATLTFSKQIKTAQQFADYVASEKGKDIFEKNGFKPVK